MVQQQANFHVVGDELVAPMAQSNGAAAAAGDQQHNFAASFYQQQQQLVKCDLQQYQVQGQHRVAERQLNGIASGQQSVSQQQISYSSPNGPSSMLICQQDLSPNQNNQCAESNTSMQVAPIAATQVEAEQQQLLARPAPIFAPKPTYYQTTTKQQDVHMRSLQQNGAVQVISPAVSVRQASAANLYYQQQLILGAANLRQQASQQQLAQTGSGGLSPVYRQQQTVTPFQQPIVSGQLSQQPNKPNYLLQPQQVQRNSTQQLLPNHTDLVASNWHQYNGGYLPQQAEQQQQAPNFLYNKDEIRGGQQADLPVQEQIARQSLGRRLALPQTRFTDRDSVSTLSRFNQFDESRSFTMRSQYTSGRVANLTIGKSDGANRLSFLRLTNEALQRLLGLVSDGEIICEQQTSKLSQRQPLVEGAGQLNFALATEESGRQKQLGKNSSIRTTAIDSGEDYYFKRKVFKYQLTILRLVNLLCAAFVLLSPVAMLLIPKMESLLGTASSNQFMLDQAESLVGGDASGQQAASRRIVVANALGLATTAKQQGGQFQAAKELVSGAPNQQTQWRIADCVSTDCDGPLIGFVVRLLVLAAAYWALFLRPQTATMPRVDLHRCLLVSTAMLVTFAYWLFYVFRLFDKRYNDFELQYTAIVQFAISLLEVLIIIHYLGVILLELRKRKKVFLLRVVRSPDGSSKYYSCGLLSIQKCAQFVLEKYHRDFSQLGPLKEQHLAFEQQLARCMQRTRCRSSRPSSPAIAAEGNYDNDKDDNQEEEGRRTGTGRRNRLARRERATSPPPQRSTSGGGHHKNRGSRSSRRSELDSTPPEERATHEKMRLSDAQANHEELPKTSSKREDIDGNSNSGNEFEHDGKASRQRKSATAATAEQNNSSDNQSSFDRQKGSSLDTVRATNEQVQPPQADLEVNERPQHRLAAADASTRNEQHESHSVRSGRSRRSHSHRNSRSHRSERSGGGYDSRRQSHSRQRSSSRQDTRADATLDRPDNIATSQTVLDLADEHECKLRKRKLRLLASVEEALEHVRIVSPPGDQHRVAGEQLGNQTELRDTSALAADQATASRLGGAAELPKPATMGAGHLDANQAARSLYPKIAHQLQKYLRFTKQTGRHNLQSIYEHLSKCLLYKLSARTFLDKFTNTSSVWQDSETNLFADCCLAAGGGAFGGQSMSHKKVCELEINSWALVCDTFLSRQIDSGTFFVLKQGQVSLLVTVAKLPHLNLSEQVIDQSSCKFQLGPDPETTSV